MWNILPRFNIIKVLKVNHLNFDGCKKISSDSWDIDDMTYHGQYDTSNDRSGFGRYVWNDKVYEG